MRSLVYATYRITDRYYGKTTLTTRLGAEYIIGELVTDRGANSRYMWERDEPMTHADMVAWRYDHPQTAKPTSKYL